MPRITKNTLLNYIPLDFRIENIINLARIFEVNNKPIKTENIVYLCEREIRAKDNFSLQFALQKSKELNLPLKIIHPKLKTAIYLNDKYSFDSPSANGYVGILWAIGGLHDRAFADYPVTGKIRRMTYNSVTKKYKMSGYLKKQASTKKD